MRFDGSEEQMNMLREIADNILDPVFLVDKSFNVWYFNRAFEAAVGVRMSSKRYKDRPCHELLGLSICKENCIMKQAVAANSNVRLAEIHGRTAGDEFRNFHINAVPVSSASGTPFGALIFLRDITAETQIHDKYKQLVAKNSAIALSGQIEQGNLADILQLFIFLQKSGQLTLEAEHGTGVIVFEQGRMVSIRLEQSHGEKAFGRLMTWSSGQFSFSPKISEEIVARIDKPADFLLMDALREQDELRAQAAALPNASVIPVVHNALQQPPEGMEAHVWEVYQQATAGSTVGAILDAVPATDAQIFRALLDLKAQGTLGW